MTTTYPTYLSHIPTPAPRSSPKNPSPTNSHTHILPTPCLPLSPAQKTIPPLLIVFFQDIRLQNPFSASCDSSQKQLLGT